MYFNEYVNYFNIRLQKNHVVRIALNYLHKARYKITKYASLIPRIMEYILKVFSGSQASIPLLLSFVLFMFHGLLRSEEI